MNRQEIYERIKKSTKDAVILEEMKKFGFWEENSGAVSLPEQMIQKEAELSKELYELLEKKRKYANRELALKEMRAERLKKSREKIAENKKKRKEERERKAREWAEKKKKDIIYLGENVSKGLNHTDDAKPEKLKEKNLPLINSAEQLAPANERSHLNDSFLIIQQNGEQGESLQAISDTEENRRYQEDICSHAKVEKCPALDIREHLKQIAVE